MLGAFVTMLSTCSILRILRHQLQYSLGCILICPESHAMIERQTILALGAGGISKMYYPEENRLERVPNVSNYEIYISRLEEMLERNEKNIFMEVKKGC